MSLETLGCAPIVRHSREDDTRRPLRSGMLSPGTFRCGRYALLTLLSHLVRPRSASPQVTYSIYGSGTEDSLISVGGSLLPRGDSEWQPSSSRHRHAARGRGASRRHQRRKQHAPVSLLGITKAA